MFSRDIFVLTFAIHDILLRSCDDNAGMSDITALSFTNLKLSAGFNFKVFPGTNVCKKLQNTFPFQDIFFSRSLHRRENEYANLAYPNLAYPNLAYPNLDSPNFAYNRTNLIIQLKLIEAINMKIQSVPTV